MTLRVIRFLLAPFLAAAVSPALAVDPALVNPANRMDPASAEWRELAAAFSGQRAVVAEFEESRHFPFRKAPVDLRGIVRIAADRGLSLQYTAPEERTVIVDGRGLLVREKGGEHAAPGDPRANAANQAMLHILRLDLKALAQDNELYGRRDGSSWVLALTPRDPGIRRAVGDIFVEGEGGAVRRIELRRSAKQFIAIRIGPPRNVTFTPEELQRFFR